MLERGFSNLENQLKSTVAVLLTTIAFKSFRVLRWLDLLTLVKKLGKESMNTCVV